MTNSRIAFSISLDEDFFLDTDHADITGFSAVPLTS
jgi:predicted glycosyltransferase